MVAFWARAERATTDIGEQGRAHWSFQPIRRPVLPAVKQQAWIATAVDAFVLEQLEAKGLSPNPPATKRELIRRVFFDIVGLPPTPEEVAAFEKNRSPDAYERLVNQLLSRHEYGERWARHWLDVVRFAQSNGYERDGEKPFAWRYRDYVIQSFNQDKPYDRFIREQIAGDELPDATLESIVATGFQRLGVWDDEPDDKRTAEFDELDDILATTGTTFLGLTLGCARCHEHKFDPIPQADYYQLLAFFRNVRPYENAKYTLDSANYIPLAAPARVKTWEAEHETRIKSLETQLQSASAEGEKKKLQDDLKKLKEEQPPFEWALAARERTGKPLPTHILARGNAASPGKEVQPAFLTVLRNEANSLSPSGGEGQGEGALQPTADDSSKGRRLTLANWIASPQNPLTARVMVNRLWQHHFGKGIVKSTTDFGRAGAAPTNAKLLDWLAAKFVNSGWSIKHMHRLILLSNAYRASSGVQNERAERIDPDNDLLWRQNLRRLEAEVIRDSILSVSGQLNGKMAGRGFFPHLAGEVLAGDSRPAQDWENSAREEQRRRSIYTYVRRTTAVPALETFDYNNTTSPLGERPVTTVAPQALLLLNDAFMQDQAAAFAMRLLTESGDVPEKQIRRGYQLALVREPTRRELNIAADFMKRQSRALDAIRSRLTFRPDVPSSLLGTYFDQLKPTAFLVGPGEGWSHYRGRWSSAYEGIRTVDRQRGPFALLNGEKFENGTVEATLTLERASEFASVLVRASAQGDEQRGYEVVLDPRQQRVIIQQHFTNILVLAEAAAAIPTGQPIPVRIEVDGSHLRVCLHGVRKPALEIVNLAATPGCIGFRSWGAPLNVDNLAITTSAGKREIGVAHAEKSQVQSFCLLLFNLNEFVYVD